MQGRGKSGGVRAIYYWVKDAQAQPHRPCSRTAQDHVHSTRRGAQVLARVKHLVRQGYTCCLPLLRGRELAQHRAMVLLNIFSQPVPVKIDAASLRNVTGVSQNACHRR